MRCSICSRANSRRRANSLNTFSRYSRASITISRPCCLASSISASTSATASFRLREDSISASWRIRAASELASRTKRSAVSAARAICCFAASRAEVSTRAVSSPRSAVTISSSNAPGAERPRVCIARSSLSKKRSRSCNRASSAETPRNKSRTSSCSNPRLTTLNCADPTAAGEDGSGRENEIAMQTTVRPA